MDGVIPQPNKHVTTVEDSFQHSLSSGKTPTLQSLEIHEKTPCRPGYGTRGQNVLLWANYFELIPSPELLLYRYNVAIQPAAVGRKLSQIIRLLLETPEYAESRKEMVTDFKSTLVSRKRLNPDISGAAIQYRTEGEDEPRVDAQTYRLRIEETAIFTVSELTDYLNSTSVTTAFTDKLPMLQALNIFLGHHAKCSPTMTTIGGNKSFSLGQASAKCDLGAGLSALRGFFSSVRVATCRILVNVNVSHGAFYNAVRLDELIQKYGSANQLNKAKLQSFLKGVRVKVTHLGEKKNKSGEIIPRVKTIFGLANQNDGHSLDHPPRVRSFGAGPKDVEFFLDGSPEVSSKGQAARGSGSKNRGKGGKSGNSTHNSGQDVSQGGRYISVYEFFRTGIAPCTSLLNFVVTKLQCTVK